MSRFLSLTVCLFICFIPLHSKGYPERNLEIADPFILLDNGIYYAYGTHSPNGIEVYTSTNLREWTLQPQLALHKKNTTEDHWFWAPEIIKTDSTYYMYYSANEHLYVATAKSPLGPFKQMGKEPMLKNRSIDSSPFIDDDGKAYLFFVYIEHGNNIYMAELSDDFLSIKPETMQQCLSVSQEWEKDPLFPYALVNEGPCVVKKQGTYYLTYSANDYRSKNYGIGYATSNSIKGPWTKSTSNPVLQHASGMEGTGHHTLFIDKDNKYRVAYHAHYSATQIHPRRTYFTTMRIKNGKLTMNNK